MHWTSIPGTVIDPVTGRPAHYGDPAGELRAALETAALTDRSDLARLAGTGPDLLGLLHRLGTGDLKSLGPGEGRATVLTTNKGRIVQRLYVTHAGAAGVLLFGGPGSAATTLAHIKRYTFAERTDLVPAGDRDRQFVVTGPRAADALRRAGCEAPARLGNVVATIGGIDVLVVGTDGDSPTGFSVLVPVESQGPAWDALLAAVREVGGTAAGGRAVEAQRVLRGLGAHGHELTEDHNPLEAGLRDAVSFTKGCYVGQEVVARLENYDKVVRSLAGIEFAPDAAPTPGQGLFIEGREFGRVTSALEPAGLGRGVGLAYVKHREVTLPAQACAGAPGTDRAVRLVPLPFPEAAAFRS